MDEKIILEMMRLLKEVDRARMSQFPRKKSSSFYINDSVKKKILLGKKLEGPLSKNSF